ncbi:hypothetical protein Q8A64_10290 [Oxalobacteraceae bacterium R-40]|uniref:Uncharacterized protein n=1 Tax=Keguizhuia sedimenti TaxID=3064264 RepID=A0ABU1BPB4_9BURK|nr:hypothetical protein [Oxalobacteraceae bacterium R-40]
MNDVPNKNASQLIVENDHPKKIISTCVLLSLPLLMIVRLVTVLGTALFSMTEGLFGTSPGTKAILLSLAIPAGALRYYHVRKNLALTSASCNLSKSQ